MTLRISSLSEYQELYRESLEAPEKYWQKVAENYSWIKEWDTIVKGDFNDLDVQWFQGGQVNITENCLDRHLETRGEQIAIYWEPNDPKASRKSFTYKEVHEQVCRFANVLKAQGIKKGDRVCFYMSMVPELLFGALACARIGAIHSVVFGGFSAQALAGRINDSKPKLLITNDQAPRGNKFIELKRIADDALKMANETPQSLVLKHTGNDIPFGDNDCWLNPLLEQASPNCPPEAMHSEDPLFILYTSGSTGKPKGLQHTTAGYMVWAGETFKNIFQSKNDDIFWCTADIGWITGHSYMTYGPFLNGATQVMFEGIPTFPDPGRFWQVVDHYQVTHFYTAPTAIRALEACDSKYHKEANLSSLKVLGSVGEPINEEAWDWYHKNIGKERCPIVDTWWQTETGGIMISNLAGVTPAKTSFATLPQPGVELGLYDDQGQELTDTIAEGNLCIKRPWPGMARTIYGDHDRYRETYFSTYKGLYFTGDGAKRDGDGHYRITGRVDDVINVSGHRIGTAEVEDAVNQHPQIVESAVVGISHEIKGQGLLAYVIAETNDSEQKIKEDLNQHITEAIGPIAKLDRIVVTSGLPKTRSGKIMRRILRKLPTGDFDSLGDVSTLLNPEIVEELKKSFQ